MDEDRILAFDIETVPDCEAGRRLHDIGSELSDDDVAEALFQLRRQESGGRDFLPLPLHRVVAIAVVYATSDKLYVGALGGLESSEFELVREFFAIIERRLPRLVSWNGSGFDLPVLHYRALRHGIAAPSYWETGDRRQEFRYRNYQARHLSSRHLDLMEALAGGGGYGRWEGRAPLDMVARLVGLPGKFGASGEEVFERIRDGRLAEVRDYCEGDVLNTYLLYLRYLYLRGERNAAAYREESARLAGWLEGHPSESRRAFLERWDRTLWDALAE